jgi:hypothetical protein
VVVNTRIPARTNGCRLQQADFPIPVRIGDANVRVAPGSHALAKGDERFCDAP